MLIPELVTLVIMAFAVSVDAFSISLGMGMFKLRLRHILMIGIVVGLFHIVMPSAGILTGYFLSATFGKVTSYVAGALLIVMGAQMIISSFRSGEQTVIAPFGKGLLLFSSVVSLDSFSAGLSLGMFGARTAAAVVIFGIVAALLTWSGLVLGRKVHNLLGIYAELLGGFILLSFGVRLLLIH